MKCHVYYFRVFLPPKWNKQTLSDSEGRLSVVRTEDPHVANAIHSLCIETPVQFLNQRKEQRLFCFELVPVLGEVIRELILE